MPLRIGAGALPTRTWVAEDGYHASDLLQDSPNPTLVTDRVLPPWPGLDIFTLLRARNPGLRIAFVENGNVHDSILAKVTGATVFLARPLTRKGRDRSARLRVRRRSDGVSVASAIGVAPSAAQLAAVVLLAVAVVHTFSTRLFERLAHIHPAHAGLWHLLGEVEVVFGFWALVFIVFLAAYEEPHRALSYLQTQSFREPAFIFVIMVISATRPILDAAAAALSAVARLLPLPPQHAYYLTILVVAPLLGSFITEPAAMTLAALLLREKYFSRQAPNSLKYVTLGVLFVNVSIGGTLTPYAAPPVLMVAERWGWDISHMLLVFGWKSALAVAVNAGAATFILRRHLQQLPISVRQSERLDVPWPVIAVHLAFLIAVVAASHEPVVFGGLFLFFLGFTEAYRRYQKPLILREGLLVAFFLAGIVVLGGMQAWWLSALLAKMNATVLYYGATMLTAITDNAALTYLGSLVDTLSPEAKYGLVAGAVSGGGLTVIANAPNPAGFSILKSAFDEGAISPLWLAIAATPPTLVAIAAFQLLPG